MTTPPRFSPWSFVHSARVYTGALVALSVTFAAGASFADNPAALPPKPGQAMPKPVKAAPELTVEQRAARGVVVIERNGQALGLGAVLGNDGRVLTAVSPLGAGNDLTVRYADGTTAKAKLGHADRIWDLALLVPQTGKWTEGLVASPREPVRSDAKIHAFTGARGKVTPAPMLLRSHKSMLGGDDKPIENAIELGSRVNPTDLGAPLVDEDGGVVGVLGRGCLPNASGPCTPVAFGSPMTAIKAFLRSTPASAVAPSAWLGIQGVAEPAGVAKGVRVLMVHPDSPADQAHLKGGDRTQSDVIVAVDGTPVGTPEALSDAIRTHGINEKVPLMVFSGGKYKTVTVQLRSAPEPKVPVSVNPAELPPATRPKR